jgi:hypothetical protein
MARTLYLYVRFALSLPIVIVVGSLAATGTQRETSGSTPSVWYVTATFAALPPVVT